MRNPRVLVAVAMSEQGQLSDVRSNDAVVIGAFAAADELGRALWRLRYGERGNVERAVALLAKRLRSNMLRRRAFRPRPPDADDGGEIGVFRRLAQRAVWEWMHDKCPACGGHAVAEIPDRSHVLGARALSCTACCGTGRAYHSDAARAASLGLPLDVYTRSWHGRLLAAIALLENVDGVAGLSVNRQLRPLA